MKFSILAAGALLVGNALAAVDPIVIKGSKFFYKTNGTQFYIMGQAYQEPYTGSGGANGDKFIDPLAQDAACKADLQYLTDIKTNTLRVYAVDPALNHDSCMSTFANAGIYVIIDLGSPDESINRNSPAWNTALFTRYTQVIDAFGNYTNVIGFFAGNEVANSANTTSAIPYVKAAVRDSKAYIKQKGYNKYVGYAAADVPDIRSQLANYLNCGPSSDSIDFFGDNVYEWCGDSSFQQSGYNNIVTEFQSYNVPYFFAEYGCNTVHPRTFTNIPTMYGPEMRDVLNGGILFEFFEDTNNFGLVSIQGSGVSKLPDYTAFSTEIASVTTSGVNSASYTPSATAAQSCPTVGASWAAASALPPTPNSNLCSCMLPTLQCVLSNNTNSSKYSELFGQVCGLNNGQACAGVVSNGTTGNYGAYSMCDAAQQLSFAFNQYFLQQQAAGNGASACDFGGAATTQSAASATGSCSSLVQQAGTAGTNSVSAGATGGSGSASTSTSSGVAYPMNAPRAVIVGSWQLGAYAVVALVSGGFMLWL